MKTLLIGCGNIANYYIQYFINRNYQFSILSRTTKQIDGNAQDLLCSFYTSLDQVNLDLYQNIIIASPIETLFDYTYYFLKNSNAYILCEKPGCIDENLMKLTEQSKGRLFYAFNRRFYKIVDRMKNYIQQDFSEQMQIIATIDERVLSVESSKKSDLVKARWMWANTTHPIDLVCYMYGYENINMEEIETFTSGRGILPWHPSGNTFLATILNHKHSIMFYSLWNASGGWSINVSTPSYTLNMPNLEKLNGPDFSYEEIDYIKPGFSVMLNSFYSKDFDRFCNLEQLMQLKKIVYKIGNYQ